MKNLIACIGHFSTASVSIASRIKSNQEAAVKFRGLNSLDSLNTT